VSTRLELVWPNKDRFLLVPRDSDGKPVWVEPTHPAASEVRLSTFTDAVGTVNGADPYSDNLMFTGDSLDALRILSDVPEFRRTYRGKVKLVYIDPPFNTGQTFAHYDDWMEHSTWLSFMRDRLLLIKDLLSPDGSVWVHLDDVEQHRMRALMDEIFGESHFVATIVWQKRYSRENRSAIGSVHDYIHVYAPRGADWKSVRNRVARTGAKEYRNPNNDPRGPWRVVPMTAQGFRPNQMYEIVTPGGATHTPSKGRCWSCVKETYDRLLAEGRIYFGKDGNAQPGILRFLSEDEGLVPWTWWPSDEVGHNDESKKELMGLFPDDEGFATPKPERLLQRVVHIATDPGDIVVDCFGGSGTTAAVAHKMGRRWVTCEILPETVDAFTRPRLEKVVDGQDSGGITTAVGWAGGGGFRTVEIGPTMYEMLDAGLVLLADWATNGTFSRAVAGQLGFEFEPDGAPFCGRRGRMRLSVIDGAVGQEEVRDLVSRLEDKERVTIVAKVVLPETEDTLAQLSPGSRIRKAPRDLLTPRRRRRPASMDGSTS
jgi:adenine-specific DNA-methyltransferase